jgi:predicted HTH domain antitoxin
MNKTLTVEYPETLPDALNMSTGEFEREARLAMAAKLFETGKLSSGQAAQLVGIPRIHFLYELQRFGVSMIQTPVEELEQDITHAAKAAGRH